MVWHTVYWSKALKNSAPVSCKNMSFELVQVKINFKSNRDIFQKSDFSHPQCFVCLPHMKATLPFPQLSIFDVKQWQQAVPFPLAVTQAARMWLQDNEQ